MSKYAVVLVALATVLTGCAGSSQRAIPVIDNGTPLTPGVMRDSRARNTEAMGQSRQAAGMQSMPQGGDDTVQTYAAPSAPIGGIQIYNDNSSTPMAPNNAPVTSAPIGEQARLAADEQLAGPVLALLTTAQQQQAGGDFNGAASSLERAQRIAPREPQVLYRLAEVRLSQGDAAQAEQLAQRGLSYSNGRPALQAGLWDLIARARAQQGNQVGAQEAQNRARVNL